MRNYKHYVIRLRPRERSNFLAFDIIVTFNTAKPKTRKVISKIGYFNVGVNNKSLGVNFMKLAYYLNRGAIVNKTVKSLISKHLAC